MISGSPLNISSYSPIITGAARKTDAKINIGNSGGDFKTLLQGALETSEVKFSGHAKDRLKNRKVELDEGKVKRLNSAVERAREKGSNESLIMLDDVALVVSVKNNTVITVMTGDTIKDNVFTNIDSAVIA